MLINPAIHLTNHMCVFIQVLINTHMKVKEITEACWSRYKQVGMKKKGSRTVPNCVPKENYVTNTHMGMGSERPQNRQLIERPRNRPLKDNIGMSVGQAAAGGAWANSKI